MKKTRRRLALAAFQVAFFLVLLELVGLVDYWVKTRRLYYFHRPVAEAPPTDATGSVPFDSPVPDALARGGLLPQAVEAYRLHPYFGFVLRPLYDIEEAPQGLTAVNNHGFLSPERYPYTRRGEDEVVVGVFGGSVAAKLALFERREKIVAWRLAAALGKSVDDVTVLNFAQGGFKQPQQLLVYTYFRALGAELDLVINVDGFNEIALAAANSRRGLTAEMPSVDHIGGLQLMAGTVERANDSHDYLERMLRVRTAHRRYARMLERTWGAQAWELSFAGGFFIDRKLAKHFRKRYRAALEEHAKHQRAAGGEDASSWLYLDRLPDPGRDAVAAAVELWAGASAEIHAAQADDGVYLHFLQPNQYHPTARVFGEAERAVAFDAGSPYAESVRDGYPRLRRAARRLRDSGVPIWDLSELFDDLPEAVYADSCCHYTEAGQRALAEAVAEVAAAAMTGVSSPLPPARPAASGPAARPR